MSMRDVREIVNRREREVDRIREVEGLMRQLYELYANPQPISVQREGRREHVPLVNAAEELVNTLLQRYREIQPSLADRERRIFEDVIAQLSGTYKLLATAAREYHTTRAQPDIQTANRYADAIRRVDRNLERTIPRYIEHSLW